MLHIYRNSLWCSWLVALLIFYYVRSFNNVIVEELHKVRKCGNEAPEFFATTWMATMMWVISDEACFWGLSLFLSWFFAWCSSLWKCESNGWGSGVGDGSAGAQTQPPKFWFVENFGKTLKIWAKPLKIWVKSLTILAKMAPNICRKTQWSFLEVTPKTGLPFLCGRKFVGKRRTKAFRASLV